MAKGRELTFRCFIERNGEIVPFTGYTPEEEKRVQKRLSDTVSAYFTQHPDEFKILCEGST